MIKLETIGRLTADPQIKNLGGRDVTTFTVASPSRRKDAEGNFLSSFFNCTVFGAVREACAQNLRKGSRVYVGGDFSVREYKDASGTNKTALDLTVNDIQFLDPKNPPTTNGAPHNARVKTAVPTADYINPDDDDQLPF